MERRRREDDRKESPSSSLRNESRIKNSTMTTWTDLEYQVASKCGKSDLLKLYTQYSELDEIEQS